MEEEEDFDATRWLDRSLIRLCRCGPAVQTSWRGSRVARGRVGLLLQLGVALSPRCRGLAAPNRLLACRRPRCPRLSVSHLAPLPFPRRRSRFGDYRKDDPDSFQLRPQLSYYPQFMFNFRRSQFIQVGRGGGGGGLLRCLARAVRCVQLWGRRACVEGWAAVCGGPASQREGHTQCL